MENLSNDLWQHIADRLAGEETPEGERVVAQWLAESSDHRHFLARMERGWSGVQEPSRPPVDTEAMKAAVAHRIGVAALDGTTASVRTNATSRMQGRQRLAEGARFGRAGQDRGVFRRRGWMWLAGAVGAVCIAAVVLRSVSSFEDGTTRTITTRADQQKDVALSDGSHMTLSPGTTVRIVRFGSRSRTVELDNGEAYFEVARASGAPFLVRSGNVTTRVLGTAFLVRHAARDAHVYVAVSDGKVGVATLGTSHAALTLTAGHVGDVTDSTTRVGTVDDATSGVEHLRDRLVFHHVPATRVLDAVSRWYGYCFRYDDSSLVQKELTVSVSLRSSAAALSILERILSVNLSVVGDTVTLTPRVTRAKNGTPRIRSYDTWTPTKEVGR